MVQNMPQLDLVEFIERNILPRYSEFDKAHDLSHVMKVIKRSIKLANSIGADVNMAYTVAAYHDIGMSGPRAVHHITGGRMLARDARLKKWFSPEQIRIMKEAVEDHRASSSHAPRSLYGKIVAEADRDLEPDSVFRRTVQYGLANYPDATAEQQWKRFYEHLESKYSVNGYIRLWIPGTDNEKNLSVVRSYIEDPAKLRKIFDRIYAEEAPGKAPDGRFNGLE